MFPYTSTFSDPYHMGSKEMSLLHTW